MKEVLERKDKELSQSREKNKLYPIGRRKKNIKTTMGIVEYKERLYRVNGSNNGKKHIYLLKDKLDLDGNISTLLKEKIVKTATKVSLEI